MSGVTAGSPPATDLLEQKLLALGPHYCDFGRVMPVARALREQVDWSALRARTGRNPYGEAFYCSPTASAPRDGTLR